MLDFFCSEHKLVVEVDGIVHDEQVLQDQARTALLQQYGYRVLRFRNEEIMIDRDRVLARICEFAERH